MMSLPRRLSVLAALFVSALALPAQSSSAFEGKWVFNAEKSNFATGPLPQSETLTFMNGTTTVEGVSAQGKPFLWSFTAAEGKAVWVDGRDRLTVATAESGNTLVHIWSDNSGTSRGEAQISADGKTMQYVLVGSRWGHPVYELSVFEKQ